MTDDYPSLITHLFKNHYNVVTSTVKGDKCTYYCTGLSTNHVDDFMIYTSDIDEVVHYSVIFHYDEYGRITLFNERALRDLFNKENGVFTNIHIEEHCTTLYGSVPKVSFDTEFANTVINYVSNSSLIHWFDRIKYKCGNSTTYALDKLDELVQQNVAKDVLASEIRNAKQAIFYYPANRFFSEDTFLQITNILLRNEALDFRVIERVVTAPVEEIKNALNFLIDAKIINKDTNHSYSLTSKDTYYFLFDLVRPENKDYLAKIFSEV